MLIGKTAQFLSGVGLWIQRETDQQDMPITGEGLLQLQHGGGGLRAALRAAAEKEMRHPDLAAQIVTRDGPAIALGQGKRGNFTQLRLQGACPLCQIFRFGTGRAQTKTREKERQSEGPIHRFALVPTDHSPRCQSRTISGNSTIIIIVPRIMTGMMRKYSLLHSNLRCMKIMATHTALMMAIIRMMPALVWFWPMIQLTRKDRAVHTTRTAKMPI